MPAIQDKVDLLFGSTGDFALGQDNDLADTGGDVLYSFKQECLSRIKSGTLDWALHPYLGSDLDDIAGEPSSREVAERGVEKIRNALTMGAFIPVADVNIKYTPVKNNAIFYVLKIKVAPTIENDMTSEVQLNLLFNIDQKNIFVV